MRPGGGVDAFHIREFLEELGLRNGGLTARAAQMLRRSGLAKCACPRNAGRQRSGGGTLGAGRTGCEERVETGHGISPVC